MSFLRDTVRMLLWRCFAIAIGALTAVFVARWLGPVDRGVFALMFLWVGLAALVLQFGIPEASIYLIGSGQYPEVQVMSSVLIWFIGAAGVGSIACFAVCLGLGLSIDTAMLLSCVLALLILTAALRHFLLARREFGRYSFSVVIEAATNLAMLAILHRALGLSLDLALIAYLGALAAAFAILVSWLPRRDSAPAIRHVRFAVLVAGGKHGVHLLVTGIGGFGIQRIGYLLLEWFSGVRAVGLFAAASALPVLFSNLPQQLATVLYSHVSASGAERGTRLAAAVFQLLAALGLLLLVPVYLVRDDIAILFGNEFSGIGDTIAVLSAGMLLTGLYGVLFNALAGTGSARVGGVLTALTLSLFSVLGCLLIPAFGLIGAAWAQFGAATLSLAVVIFLFCRRLGVSARILFVPGLTGMKLFLPGRGMK